MLRKISNGVLVSLCCILLGWPHTILAEDNDSDKGKIKWDTDRILNDRKDEDEDLQETELDKLFPELFDVETKETVQQVQEENKESLTELENSLFSKELKEDDTVEKTEESLFTSDYVAPPPSTNQEEEQDDQNTGLYTVLVLSFIGLGVLVLGGVYFMFQKMTD